MESEKIQVNLMMKDNNIVRYNLELFEEAPDDKDMVLLKLTIDEKKISCKSANFFDALLDLRKELEKTDIIIMCNGAAENVYPSPMQQSMGSGRVAYKQFLGQKAKIADVVDIFECDESLNFVNIDKQLKFNIEWQKSITG